MRIIGIDPGSMGGMACFVEDANGPDVFKFDGATEADIANRLREWCHAGETAKVYVERVSSRPGEGVVAAFTFGTNYGFLRGVLAALEVPREFVTSGTWCKTFGLKRAKDESKTDWKNRHKAKAQELFPGVKITHAFADALLIAEHARRVELITQGAQR